MAIVKKTFETPERVYSCPECSYQYDTKADAIKCCIGAIPVQYRCPLCDEVYDTPAECKVCCPIYQCIDCGGYHETKDEAADCCPGV